MWIPSAKAVVGGIPVSSGIHLWMVDTPTTKDRNEVVQALESIKSLKPNVVAPAHMKAGAAEGLDAVNFSIDYLKQYEKAAKVTKTSTDLIQMMHKEYPTLPAPTTIIFIV